MEMLHLLCNKIYKKKMCPGVCTADNSISNIAHKNMSLNTGSHLLNPKIQRQAQ